MVTADDFNAIADTTFTLIDPKGDIRMIVIPSTLDRRAVAALRRVRPVAPFVQAASTANEVLPAGYFLIRTFSIGEKEGNEVAANVEGQLGPVTRTVTGANIPDCGKIYSVAFELTGGEWFSPSYKIETCAESRHWVPVDSSQP